MFRDRFCAQSLTDSQPFAKFLPEGKSSRSGLALALGLGLGLDPTTLYRVKGPYIWTYTVPEPLTVLQQSTPNLTPVFSLPQTSKRSCRPRSTASLNTSTRATTMAWPASTPKTAEYCRIWPKRRTEMKVSFSGLLC